MRSALRTYVLTLLAALLATGMLPLAVAEEGAGQVLSLFITSHVAGELEPCGCERNQLGGLPRRGNALRQIRAGGAATLLVDPGNLLFPSLRPPAAEREQWKLKAEELVRAYALLGYDAVGLGRDDFAFSVDFVKGILSDKDLLFLSSNVREERSGSFPFAPYVLVERGGLDIGIFALTHPTAPVGEGYMVESPMEAARRTLAELAPRSDLIVLLSDLDRDEVEATAAAFPQISVVVGTRENEPFASPLEGGRTFLVQPRDRGQELGRLDIVPRERQPSGEEARDADEATPGWNYTYTAIPLDQEWEDDADLVALIDDYKAKLARLPEPSVDAKAAQDAQFLRVKHQALLVEASFCRQCHQNVYNHWLTTKHSRAYATLEEQRYEQSPECLKCHTTGPQLEDGDWADLASNPRDIQCVACHRSGHRPPDSPARAERMSAEVCLTCHTHENSPNFHYDAYYAMIRHPAR